MHADRIDDDGLPRVIEWYVWIGISQIAGGKCTTFLRCVRAAERVMLGTLSAHQHLDLVIRDISCVLAAVSPEPEAGTGSPPGRSRLAAQNAQSTTCPTMYARATTSPC